MIGQLFGKWTVLQEVKIQQKRASVFKHYLCRCECGLEKVVRADGLRNGRSSQCADCRKKRYIDTDAMIGKSYGDWLAIDNAPPTKNKQRNVLCRCKCGKEAIITASKLKLGRSKSCMQCKNNGHGMEGTPTYNSWHSMITRCGDPNNKNYYGRGITVCERWNIFKNFLEDMGIRPNGHQIDRINNNGNYEPSNCRWVTPKQNSNNRRKRSP